MAPKCPGCNEELNEMCWTSQDFFTFGLCHECYKIHQYSTSKKWSIKKKRWISLQEVRDCKECSLELCHNDKSKCILKKEERKFKQTTLF